MEEVGRVSIRVVPDFRHFRKHLNRVLKQYDNRTLNWKIDIDGDAGKKLLNNLQGDVAKAGKVIKKDLTKAAKDATKSVNKNAQINPTLALDRFKRRYSTAVSKVLDDAELILPLNMGGEKERKRLQRQAAKILAGIDEIDPQAGNSLTQRKQAIKQYKELVKSVADYNSNLTRSRQLHEDESVRLRRAVQSHKDLAAAIIKGKRANTFSYDIDKIFSPAELAAAEQNIKRLADNAGRSIANLDRKFSAAFDNQKRAALNSYVYGVRDLDGNVNRLLTRTDRIRLGGGVLGSLFGGAGAIAGAKAAVGAIKAGQKAAAGMAGMLSKITPQFGTGVNLPAYALIAALITPLLALASGIIVAAPAALAAIAAPIAAIALGLDGIKKAALAVQPAFDAMRENIAGVFERGMVPGFNTLKDTIIPGLTGSFQGLAGSLSTMFNSFTSNLASDTNMTAMQTTIRNVGIAAQQSMPGINNFTNGILKLVSNLSEKFPGISEAINRTGQSFADWVDRITTIDSSGTSKLDRAMKTLGDTLSGLGGIISDLFNFGFDKLGDEKFGASMISFVDDIRKLVSETLPALGKAFEGIATALRPITAIVEAGSTAISGFNDVTQRIGASMKMPEIADNFGQIMDSMPTMSGLDKIGFVWDSFFNKDEARVKLAEAITGARIAGQEAAASSGRAVGEQYVQGMVAAISTNKEAQAEVLKAAFSPDGVTQAVAAQITSQAGVAITGAQQALIPLKEGLQTDIKAALQPLGDIAGKVATAFDSVPGLINGSLGQIPAMVSQQMGAIKTTAETSMTGFSDAVVTHLAIAVTTAQNQAPAIKAPFESLAGEMFAVGAQMMAGLAKGITGSVGFATAAAAAAARRVKEAADAAAGIESPSREFMKTGDYMMQGMQVGIQNGTAGPVAAMREVMQAIKDVFGSAEGLNLNFFMGQAATSMSAMADSSKEFRSNMVEAGTTPALNPETTGAAAETQMSLDEIKRLKAENALRMSELRQQIGLTEDKAAKAALNNEIKALDVQQKRLDLMKQEAPMQEERKTAIQQLSDTIATSIQDMIRMPADFANATIGAATQDLGISGSGALPTIANWAMDAGTNFIFNVSNMDDALQGQQAQQNRQKLGITG